MRHHIQKLVQRQTSIKKSTSKPSWRSISPTTAGCTRRTTPAMTASWPSSRGPHRLSQGDAAGGMGEAQRDWHNGSTERLLLERICSVMDAEGSLSVLRHPAEGRQRPLRTVPIQALPRAQPGHDGPLRQSSPPGDAAGPLLAPPRGLHRPRVLRQRHSRGDGGNEDRLHSVGAGRDLPVPQGSPARDPATKKAEPLLTFKRRALVHFAVSTDQVYMTTELAGGATRFLPFNLGHGAAGNPPNPSGYRTAYLWERVLQRTTGCTSSAASSIWKRSRGSARTERRPPRRG